MGITDFINGKVIYDKQYGKYFWIKTPKDGEKLLCTLEGWDDIQGMFIDGDDNVDQESASTFQDQLGDWVAAAINEKLERESKIEI